MHFNKILKICVLMICASALAACAQSEQVENQAYAVVMGIDRTDNGDMEITVQLPKIAASGGESEGSGKSDSSYFQVSVKGSNYEAALERLHWAVPRNLNFSQLKTVVFSREVAESEDFAKLIKSVVQTERLFTAAYVVVCEDNAKEFVEAMKPAMGSQLSADITATFEHYYSHGIIPNSTLADLYYRGMSFYSEPMAIYGVLNKQDAQQEAAEADAIAGTPTEFSSEVDSEIETYYLGAALFSKNVMCGLFNEEQTVITNLLRNEVKSIEYEYDGQSLEFSPIGKCKIRIDTDAEPVQIQIEIHLSAVSQQEMPDMAKLQERFESDVRKVISAAQAYGIEPFEFSGIATRNFSSIEKWREFNWQEKFSAADVEVTVHFTRSDA